MKKLLIGIVLFLLSCSGLKNHLSSIDEIKISEDEALNHANFVLESMQDQGFAAVLGKLKENRIFLDLEINKKPVDFFLDTGASFSFIGEKQVKKYRLQRVSSSSEKTSKILTFFGGITEYDQALATEFIFGQFRFMPWPFTIYESQSREAVLGADFLHFGSAVIFCRFGAVLFSVEHEPAKNLNNQLKELGYTEIDLVLARNSDIEKIRWIDDSEERELLSGVLMMPITFDGIEGIVILDTGIPYTTLDRNYVELKGKKTIRYNNLVVQDAAGNTSHAFSVKLDSLKTENYTLATENYFGVLDELEFKSFQSKYNLPTVGVLGIDILSKHNAVIDFGNQKLYLQP